MADIIQITGAVLILVAFAGSQRGLLGVHAKSYLVLNLLGAAILTGVAWDERDWGFLMLESVWSVMSAWSLVQVLSGRQPAGGH